MINYKNLCCPLDDKVLIPKNRSFSCQQHHNYDVAKEGYLNLLLSQHKRSKSPGDSQEMVDARRQFLEANHYAPIANTLLTICEDFFSIDQKIDILDAGCGEGYYLNYLQERLATFNEYIGVDISKPAIIAAAKKYTQIHWLVASNARLPICHEKIDLICCLFGFITPDSFLRVLRPSGYVVTADPSDNHLIELRQIIYPEIYQHSRKHLLEKNDHFDLKEIKPVCYSVTLDQKAIYQLVLMTPHFFRATADRKEKLLSLDKLKVTIDVGFRVYQKRYTKK